jgi:hypothetical protein
MGTEVISMDVIEADRDDLDMCCGKQGQMDKRVVEIPPQGENPILILYSWTWIKDWNTFLISTYCSYHEYQILYGTSKKLIVSHFYTYTPCDVIFKKILLYVHATQSGKNC